MKLPEKLYTVRNDVLVFVSFLFILFLSAVFFSLIRLQKPFSLVSPKPRDVIFESMVSKLDVHENTFVLKKSFSIIPQAFASADYSNAASYIAIDNTTGDIILEKDPTHQLSIASLTKIMTAIVALDLASPNEIFTVQNDVSAITPTIIGVVPGQKMTFEELLHAMLMTSANDAAQVIKDTINQKYHEDIFTHAMNEKAIFIGLKNSHFDNPQGFDSTKNFSSAYDLALLAHYALTNYPLIADIVKKDYVHLPVTDTHKQFDLYNWNGLLDVYPNVYGVKIGNTESAGTTMIVGSEREGKNVLVVLLGAPGILQRDVWASEILDDAFQKQFGLDPIHVTIQQLREKYGTWKYFQ